MNGSGTCPISAQTSQKSSIFMYLFIFLWLTPLFGLSCCTFTSCLVRWHLFLISKMSNCTSKSLRQRSTQTRTCSAGLHLAGISVTLADKASEDKGVVLVARRPLAFMSLDAPQGSSTAWLAGRGGRWGNVRWTLLKRLLSHLSGIYAPSTAKGIVSHFIPSWFFFLLPIATVQPDLFFSFLSHLSLWFSTGHAFLWMQGIRPFLCLPSLSFHHEHDSRRPAAGWHCVCSVKAVE